MRIKFESMNSKNKDLATHHYTIFHLFRLFVEKLNKQHISLDLGYVLVENTTQKTHCNKFLSVLIHDIYDTVILYIKMMLLYRKSLFL